VCNNLSFCKLNHLKESSLLHSHLPQFQRIQCPDKLTFNLRENQLVLRHHRNRFFMQHVLLIVFNQALLPSQRPLQLLLQRKVVLTGTAILILDLFDVLLELLL
jgi:hypothetical protein